MLRRSEGGGLYEVRAKERAVRATECGRKDKTERKRLKKLTRLAAPASVGITRGQVDLPAAWTR